MENRTAQARLAHAVTAAGLDWIVPEWPVPEGVCALATTRNGGGSTGPRASMNLGRNARDESTALAQNRHALAQFLPARPTWLDQVHGAGVAILTAGSGNDPVPVADAAVTRERGVVCAVLTADCLPVLFADRQGRAVGIAHAGWRGLYAGVLEGTIAKLSVLGVEPDQLVAWLGPAIGPSRFEVGSDVRDPFCADAADAQAWFKPHGSGKWLADLYGLARLRLARGGVPHVSGGGYCTHTDATRFFSYRRERDTGRMATLVWLAP